MRLAFEIVVVGLLCLSAPLFFYWQVDIPHWLNLAVVLSAYLVLNRGFPKLGSTSLSGLNKAASLSILFSIAIMLLFASKEAIYLDGIEVQYTPKVLLEPPLKIIYSIFTAALEEEILYRAMLIGLLVKLNFRFKVLISSIVFTLSHVSLYQFEIPMLYRAETACQLLLSGLLLGMLYTRYSLSTAIVFHILYNSYTAFLRPVLVNLERLQLGLLLCLGVVYSLIVVGREIKIIVNNRLTLKHWSLDT